MKKTTKIFGKSIPAALLIAIVIVGLVAASYTVWSYTFSTTVTEPISVTVTKEFTNPMSPGLGTNSEYMIHNSGPIGLSVTVTWPASNPDNKIAVYATIRYSDAQGGSGADIVRVDYDGTETFNLPSDGYAKVQIGLLVFADAPPVPINVPVTVSRG